MAERTNQSGASWLWTATHDHIRDAVSVFAWRAADRHWVAGPKLACVGVSSRGMPAGDFLCNVVNAVLSAVHNTAGSMETCKLSTALP